MGLDKTLRNRATRIHVAKLIGFGFGRRIRWWCCRTGVDASSRQEPRVHVVWDARHHSRFHALWRDPIWSVCCAANRNETLDDQCRSGTRRDRDVATVRSGWGSNVSHCHWRRTCACTYRVAPPFSIRSGGPRPRSGCICNPQFRPRFWMVATIGSGRRRATRNLRFNHLGNTLDPSRQFRRAAQKQASQGRCECRVGGCGSHPAPHRRHPVVLSG
jgi:hypothetical protein